MLLVLNSISNYKTTELSYSYVLTLITFIAGTYSFFYAYIAFSSLSIFAPRVKVSESLIVLKEGVFKRSKTLAWSEIHHIHFGSYHIDFKLSDSTVEFDYSASARISLKVKELILGMANVKNIETSGG